MVLFHIVSVRCKFQPCEGKSVSHKCYKTSNKTVNLIISMALDQERQSSAFKPLKRLNVKHLWRVLLTIAKVKWQQKMDPALCFQVVLLFAQLLQRQLDNTGQDISLLSNIVCNRNGLCVNLPCSGWLRAQWQTKLYSDSRDDREPM